MGQYVTVVCYAGGASFTVYQGGLVSPVFLKTTQFQMAVYLDPRASGKGSGALLKIGNALRNMIRYKSKSIMGQVHVTC